jgi:hypothetical protein
LLPDQSTRAGQHLVGRATRESEKQNTLRWNAFVDELRDSTGERLGLAGARAGDDQERPVAVRHRLALRRIQPLQPRTRHDELFRSPCPTV